MMMAEDIAKKIKNISLDDAVDDFIRLQNIDLQETSQLSRIGLKFLDYYFYVERLSTVGNKGISFFTFLEDFELHRQRSEYIYRLYEMKKHKYPTNFTKCVKQIFDLYFGSINLFRPIVAMNVYERYKPKNVLNVCSGWGGFLVGGCAMNIPKITAIDNNKNLFLPYTDMIQELNKYSSSDIKFICGNALTVDISKIGYDMIICSPPYYNKEIYAHLPAPYDTKKEWEESFYKPLFKRVWEHLEVNGKMVINVPIEIYDKSLVPLFGQADEKLLLPKYNKKNNYKEFLYVYHKINE